MSILCLRRLAQPEKRVEMMKLVGLLVLAAGVASAAIPQTERDVLIALYNSTNGDSWTTNTNWKTAGSFDPAGTECNWHGVFCTSTSDHVEQVHLAYNQLTGSIPSLTGLTNLQYFNVRSNQLTGSIPSLTGLTNLQYFNVHSNQLTGSIPSLTGLTNLQYFDVSSNQLTGSIPSLTDTIPSLTGLTNLQYFDASSNQLTGSIPSLTGLTSFFFFAADSNQLTGSIPSLTGLTNLSYFYVYSNQLTGSIPSLTGLTNLQYFLVYSNQLTGSIPSLTGLTSLSYFYVYSNQLTGSIPSLTGLTNLSYFYVYSNQLTGPVPNPPSPSALSAGQSGLCPNYLTQSLSPAWDTATGSTPWYTTCLAAVPPAPLQMTPLGTMSISVVPNQSLQATGTVAVTANQNGSWTATTSTPWLSLTQSSGGFPGVVAGIANAAGLAAGSYTGSISVAGIAPGGTQTISIPVTLTVNSPAVLTSNPTAISMASGYPAGSATGYTIQTGAPGLAFTAATSASSAGWLTVSPTSGIAPTPITVTLDPSQATPGIYTDSIVVSSPGVASVSIPVKMSVAGIIATLPQQVNAATQAGPDHTVAPNQLVTLYLTNFTCATAPVVSINGIAVSWSSYVAGQINYAVPANITSPAALTVACNGTTAWSFNGLTTAAVVPGIFTISGTGKGQAAGINSDGTTNSSTNPATRGSWLSVYGTGFGVFNAAGTNGLRTVAGNVTATIGGVDATVLYAGNSPGSTDGLQQFNLQIPAGLTAGTAVPIVLTVNGTPTQTTATVSLQ